MTIDIEEQKKLLKDPSMLLKSMDGKLYLAETPADSHADMRPPARILDKRYWSASRKADFEFYKKELAALPSDKIFLDVGAGTGLFREIFGRFRYVGLDLYPYDVVSVVADIKKGLPFKDGSCDVVMLSNVLEHTPAPEVLLSECYRVLKPGGLLIGSVPFLAHVHQEPYDFLRYTHYMLDLLFKKAGFADISIVPLERPVDFYQWARQRFFDALLYETPLSFWKRSVAWLAYKLVRLIETLFHPVFLEAGQSYQLARRFGFKARRP